MIETLQTRLLVEILVVVKVDFLSPFFVEVKP